MAGDYCMIGAFGVRPLIVLMMRFSPAMLPHVLLQSDEGQLREMESNGFTPYYMILGFDWV